MPTNPSIYFFAGSTVAGQGSGFAGGPLYEIPSAGIQYPAPQSAHAAGLWMTYPDGTQVQCVDVFSGAGGASLGCTFEDRFDLGFAASVGTLTVFQLCGAGSISRLFIGLQCDIQTGLYVLEWYIPTFVTEPGFGPGICDLVYQVHLTVTGAQSRCGDGSGGTGGTGGGSGLPPCTGDCPPCGSTFTLVSGQCVDVCASSTLSGSLASGWHINGPISATSDAPNGWSVQSIGLCQYRICAPCLPADKYRAGNYAGPYTMEFALGSKCHDNVSGQDMYKTQSAKFTLAAGVICPEDKSGRQVSYDVSDARRHVRAYVNNATPGTAGKVVIGLGSNALPVDWQDATTKQDANDVCVRWDRQSSDSALYLLAETGSKIQLLKSTDEGQTWQVSADVGGGKHPALLIARDGRRFCFWVSSGALQCQIYDAAGNVLNKAFLVASGVSDDSICADEFTGAQTKWGVGVAFVSSGGVRFMTSLDGVTWGGSGVVIGGGKHPAFVCARDGRRLFYWVSGTTVQGLIQDAAGNVLKPAFKAIDGVDDDGLSVDEFTNEQTKWEIGLLYRSGGKVTFRTSLDGFSF